MKIEKINENSISCTLSSFDLSVRNLNIRELAYGSEKARKLFDEMMTKARNEVGFKVENAPIMIEAIPMSSDSIKLIISKVMDPDELDARFSRFTKGPQAEKRAEESLLGKLASLLLEGAEDFMSHSQDAALDNKTAVQQTTKPGSPQTASRVTGKQTPDSTGTVIRAFAFDDLDQVIDAAKATWTFTGESVLYRRPGSGVYVLLLRGKSSTDDAFVRACNSLAEYGRVIAVAPHMDLFLEEHYDMVIRKDAITKLTKV